MSAPATDRLRIPSPRPRPATGPRHQKPDTPQVVVRTPAPTSRPEPDQEPDTVVLAAADLRAAIPGPRDGGQLRAPRPAAPVVSAAPAAAAAPVAPKLRAPSWDLLPPAPESADPTTSHVDLRVRTARV